MFQASRYNETRDRDEKLFRVQGKFPSLLPDFRQKCISCGDEAGNGTFYVCHATALRGEVWTKLVRPQEQSVFRYYPISTKLALLVAHVEAVPCVMFESPRCNAWRERDEKLFRPQD
jgi:hypothetical protein